MPKKKPFSSFEISSTSVCVSLCLFCLVFLLAMWVSPLTFLVLLYMKWCVDLVCCCCFIWSIVPFCRQVVQVKSVSVCMWVSVLPSFVYENVVCVVGLVSLFVCCCFILSIVPFVVKSSWSGVSVCVCVCMWVSLLAILPPFLYMKCCVCVCVLFVVSFVNCSSCRLVTLVRSVCACVGLAFWPIPPFVYEMVCVCACAWVLIVVVHFVVSRRGGRECVLLMWPSIIRGTLCLSVCCVAL